MERKNAGFLNRFLAYMIDYFILNFIGTIIGVIFAFPLALFLFSKGHTEEYVTTIVYAVIFPIASLVGILYYAILESSKWQGTVGKIVLKITVVDENGNRVGFWRAFLRAFCMLFSTLILGIGWLMILWTKDKRSLHDMMSGCYVVKKEEKNENEGL